MSLGFKHVTICAWVPWDKLYDVDNTRFVALDACAAEKLALSSAWNTWRRYTLHKSSVMDRQSTPCYRITTDNNTVYFVSSALNWPCMLWGNTTEQAGKLAVHGSLDSNKYVVIIVHLKLSCKLVKFELLSLPSYIRNFTTLHTSFGEQSQKIVLCRQLITGLSSQQYTLTSFRHLTL